MPVKLLPLNFTVTLVTWDEEEIGQHRSGVGSVLNWGLTEYYFFLLWLSLLYLDHVKYLSWGTNWAPLYLISVFFFVNKVLCVYVCIHVSALLELSEILSHM